MTAFFGIFAVMAVLEFFWPRRRQVIGRLRRWPNNIAISVLNSLLLRFLIPTAAVGLAWIASDNGWGLLNLVALPVAFEVVFGVLLLDLAIYFQHRIFHAVPILWRLHRMHHSDLEIDVTTGARFHPLEILLSMGIKMILVLLLGPSALAVLLFEVLLNGSSMFNHANVRIPLALDKVLRVLLVTPDMHRVHHSIISNETNSNFGFCLSVWDRIFKSYKAQPHKGHEGMTIGLEIFRNPAEHRLDKLLVQPFLSRNKQDSAIENF
ncbi:MAG: sterol desaturase family protein [Kiloniellales bacterium]|nr:sterol desaturase family protein [Kiloniellales bacterium]